MRNSLETDLRLQDLRVLESRSLIEKQRSFIAKLEEEGRDTALARAVLSKLVELHRLRERNLENLRIEGEEAE